MKYLKVHWVHDFDDEPEMLYSEIDSHDNEVRKVEVFKDGSMGYAREGLSHRSKLAECEMPSIAEIAEDEQFKPEAIDSTEFDDIWEKSQG